MCNTEQVGNLSEHARRKSIWRHILGVFRGFICFKADKTTFYNI